MSQDKVQMPMSTAGITRYFEEYHSRIEFKPGHVIIICIVVMILIILLNMWGGSLLG